MTMINNPLVPAKPCQQFSTRSVIGRYPEQPSGAKEQGLLSDGRKDAIKDGLVRFTNPILWSRLQLFAAWLTICAAA